MKTRTWLPGFGALAAMVMCLIPVFAQEPASRPIDGSATTPEAAQRARQQSDLFAAVGAVNRPTRPQESFPNRPAALPAPAANPLFGQNSQAAAPALTTTRSFFGGRSMFDPKLAEEINKSNNEVGKLIQQLKKADEDSEKEDIKSKIKSELDIQYDAYLEHHQQPLKQLEERVAKLRKEFEARKKAKDDLVKLRLDTIWYDALGLGWPSNRGTSIYRSGPAAFPAPYAQPGQYVPMLPGMNQQRLPSRSDSAPEDVSNLNLTGTGRTP